VAVHAVANVAGLRTNQTIAVWGAGPIGLLCLATAKALGASRVISVDIVPSRLDFAKSYAATQTFLPPARLPNETNSAHSKRCVEAMREQLGIEEHGPKSIDIVVDASGAEVSIQTAIQIVKTGGTYVQACLVSLDSFAHPKNMPTGWNGKCRGSNPDHHTLGERSEPQGILQIWRG
jgi:D-xylulose reductase